MLDLKDKVVLITGASTGIGAAVAKGYAKAGSKVAVHYGSSKKEADEVNAEIKAAGGISEVFQADVKDTAQIKQMVADVVSKFGQLDVLICNAGGLVARSPLEEITAELYEEVMTLNVRSVMDCCAAASPHLIETGGNMIITGSLAARMGGGGGASLYAGAKAAVENMMRNYAREYAEKGVRVNSVSPGTIYTLFHQVHTPAATLEMIKGTIPLKRLGTPEDCVGTYLYLGSNALSAYVTGQVVEVNGGQLMP